VTTEDRLEMIRFAVVCDMHVERKDDLQHRYFMEALRRAAAMSPGFLVVLGDLTARGGEQALAAVAEAAKGFPVKTYVLPGNSDVRDTPIETCRKILGEPRFSFRMGQTLFLGLDTAQPALSGEQREWLKQGLAAAAGAKLVILTHIPPYKLEAQSQAFMETLLAQSRATLYVAGHSHRPDVREIGGCAIHTLGGTDPFKPVQVQPGFSLFTMDGDARAERHEITLLSEGEVESVLSRVGAAPAGRCSMPEIVALLDQCRLKHVQFKPLNDASPNDSSALKAWRRRTPGATVSVHLRSPIADEVGRLSNRADLQDEVRTALELEAVSVTAHLPKIDSKWVLDGARQVKDDPYAKLLCRDIVEVLAPLLASGVEVHIENLRWRGTDLRGERCLGVAPSHLTAFRDLLASRSDQIGFTLDVGHAWGNGSLASTYPPYKWFEALHPHIRSVHLHDMVPADRRQVTHLPLGSEGGTVGFEGTLYLLSHLAPEAVIYLEMSALQDIGLSIERLRAWRPPLSA
jgi:sugar phosphate isomerase/epimerase/predicted phosphodiesterase